MCNNPGQVVHTLVPLSPGSKICYKRIQYQNVTNDRQNMRNRCLSQDNGQMKPRRNKVPNVLITYVYYLQSDIIISGNLETNNVAKCYYYCQQQCIQCWHIPAIFTGWVNTSCSCVLVRLSALENQLNLGASPSTVGVNNTSTPASKTCLKSLAISRRTFCAFT